MGLAVVYHLKATCARVAFFIYPLFYWGLAYSLSYFNSLSGLVQYA